MVYDQTDCWIGLKNGDPEALGYLYDHYADKLFEAALWITDNRELAKDAIQEMFIDLWNYRSSLGQVVHTQSYLIRVLQNILFKKLKTRSAATISLETAEVYDEERNAEEKWISDDTDRENLVRLSRACQQLTARQQTIIRMRFYEGLSYKQIAMQLGMNYQSVNNLVFRALINLRREI